ncbi:HAMP domain-containing sensor histidine kinase [Sphingobacterium oryzagri]|uniref:histidine kinase n=1 Tax=Sphingobacterium oryzagri TaxID=3025669 RepID=A0ABY7WPX4_9SPHI|nr:HAMP domain-containing sensor histidine kinase [Sphingobacterium sp. KACC 22765]WDF70599.1 HAMP domain-containing sensor histidine kinase [Sphingobacterium sp. KACC 22765]
MNKKHIPISIISFSVLFVVQYLLIYNTFELRNNQYQVFERKTLDSAYRHLLLNDKLFLGGQEIIDSLIKPHYPIFLAASEEGPDAFHRVSASFCDTLIASLRAKSNMDSIFRTLIRENALDSNLTYSLIVTDFEITFDGRNYRPVLAGNWLINREHPHILIDGDLEDINKQNLITGLTVSSPQGNSYKIAFSLHADDINSRFYKILRQMAPTLLLSALAIAMVIGIYYLTYRNWVRQKKMTEMTSDFLNSITHEFHTPITTIIVANRSIENLDRAALEEKIKEFTAIIARQSSRLQKLIKQALNITELNQYNVEKERFALLPLLSESVNDYRLALDQNIVMELINDLHTPDQEIYVNKFLFTTAIYNIFDNAIKYNQNAQKSITVRLLQTADNLGIQISDNGIGLNEEHFQRVFQKFYRGKESNNRPGLGLGLFYVKKVAEAHGWKLTVSSNKETGTTFSIWLL